MKEELEAFPSSNSVWFLHKEEGGKGRTGWEILSSLMSITRPTTTSPSTGEWWKSDIMEVYEEFLQSGGDPNTSDSYTINGQPGALQPCSASDPVDLKIEAPFGLIALTVKIYKTEFGYDDNTHNQ
ncbi:hypothetical protein HS088_TW15G00874 [Tripterygium wilfordii]|uniref:Plastocyanin-like domain-containing protein n=1 Tax=Tripterygium wilfordii TaxID=458696 RepID=A0A7J7CMR1_TRIWF|nr:hypothetical protein HS088_TW15G00874 [Tripterygium wilfordii]